MSCLKLPTVASPDLSLLLPELDIVIPDPHVGLSLCCEFSLTIPIPIPPIHITIPGIAVVLIAINLAVQQAVDQLNDLLDQVQIDCPLE